MRTFAIGLALVAAGSISFVAGARVGPELKWFGSDFVRGGDARLDYGVLAAHAYSCWSAHHYADAEASYRSAAAAAQDAGKDSLAKLYTEYAQAAHAAILREQAVQVYSGACQLLAPGRRLDYDAITLKFALAGTRASQAGDGELAQEAFYNAAVAASHRSMAKYDTLSVEYARRAASLVGPLQDAAYVLVEVFSKRPDAYRPFVGDAAEATTY